jgi:hypothetical protein
MKKSSVWARALGRSSVLGLLLAGMACFWASQGAAQDLVDIKHGYPDAQHAAPEGVCNSALGDTWAGLKRAGVDGTFNPVTGNCAGAPYDC